MDQNFYIEYCINIINLLPIIFIYTSKLKINISRGYWVIILENSKRKENVERFEVSKSKNDKYCVAFGRVHRKKV